jgi:hypothetical protein
MSDTDAQPPALSAGVIDSALYQCTTCKKTYTRVDHLSRHVRSRTWPPLRICFEARGKGYANA